MLYTEMPLTLVYAGKYGQKTAESEILTQIVLEKYFVVVIA